MSATGVIFFLSKSIIFQVIYDTAPCLTFSEFTYQERIYPYSSKSKTPLHLKKELIDNTSLIRQTFVAFFIFLNVLARYVDLANSFLFEGRGQEVYNVS